MSKLNTAVEQLIKIEGDEWERIALASQHYIEVLSRSESDEIKEMIRFVYKDYYID